MEYSYDERSNLCLKSNMMVKSRIPDRNWIHFAPVALMIKLFPEFKDSRTDKFLTAQQVEQKRNALFVAKRIVDID